MEKWSVRRSWSPLTTIENGAISRLLNMLGAPTVRFASGVAAGQRARASQICPGREPPGVFPPEVKAQATALACSRPRQEGVPLARWSSAEIAQRLIALGVVVSIATSTVGRWLKAEKLKPWRYHNWQHILDPKTFIESARPILWLYERAKRFLAKGIWVVCIDEKTSIQARERTQPPAPTVSGYAVHVEHRYERQGALHLFAGLSVGDGQVYGQCRTRKRFVDFQAFLLDVIIPEALRRGVHNLSLILDNGTTHAPKQLKPWLLAQRESGKWPFTVHIYWLPKNASWLDQIEIWFSILQRKLLKPNHFESLAALEQDILKFIDHYNQTAKPIQWTYTIEKLEKKLGTI
jgi:hypothetical protein